MYVVFARKYRPERFEDVVGQEHVARTLQNAIRNDRVAHAYLFSGSRGVGKTTMARILAKALNCEKGPTPDPCCECEPCRRIATGDFIDVREIDGASNRGIDQIRELRENVPYSPSQSRFKIYYIDEVHMLTVEAFNALLKTLEEPPSHVKFIFSTTDPQQVPETVRSRCQRFDFRRISAARIVEHLQDICQQEGIEPEEGSLPAIARAARGGLRDALSTLDQVASFSDEEIKLEEVLAVVGAVDRKVLTDMVDALADEDTATALSLLNHVLFSGVDVLDFADQLAEYLRDILVASYCEPDDEALAGAAATPETLQQQATAFDSEQITYMIQLLREAKLRAKRDTLGKLALELAIVKMSKLSRLVSVEQALAEGTSDSSQRSKKRPASRAPRRSNSKKKNSRPQKKPTNQEQTDGSSGGGKSGGGLTALRNMRTKLSGKKGTKTGPKTEDRPAPEGIDQTKFREIASSAEDSRAARQVSDDKPLLQAFSQADKVFDLRPIKLKRLKESPENEGSEDADEE